MGQREKRAFLDSFLSMLPDMTQHAAPMLSHIGLGLAAHVGSNALLKSMRSLKNNRFLLSMGELGIKHGLEGKQVHPWVMDRVKQLMGPEMVAEYAGARNLTRRAVAAIPTVSERPKQIAAAVANVLPSTAITDKAYPAIKEVASTAAKKFYNLSDNTNIANYPILGNVSQAADDMLSRWDKTRGIDVIKHTGTGGRMINWFTNGLDHFSVPAGYDKGLANPLVRDATSAGAAGAALMVPGLGDHVLINTARHVATRLPVGKGSVAGRIMQGFNNPGESKIKRTLGDLLYSPTAWGEARDFGLKARKDGFSQETITPMLKLVKDMM